MQLDAFLQLASLDGNSTDDTFEKRFEILSFHHGITRQAMRFDNTGDSLAVGRATHREATVLLPIDDLCFQFFRAICVSQEYTQAVITSRGKILDAGNPTTGNIYQLTLKRVIVTRVEYAINPVYHGFGRGIEDPPMPSTAEYVGPLMEVEFLYFGEAKWECGKAAATTDTPARTEGS